MRSPREAAGKVDDLTRDGPLATPFLAITTPAQIAEQWIAARERWGITYFVGRSLDGLEAVVDELP